MAEELDTLSWQDLKKRRSFMWSRALSKLTEEEKHILDKLLELEAANRALNTPNKVRAPLREFVEREIR
jgi:hypothetical protein